MGRHGRRERSGVPLGDLATGQEWVGMAGGGSQVFPGARRGQSGVPLEVLATGQVWQEGTVKGSPGGNVATGWQ